MWVAVVAIGVGTYLTRLSFIGAFGEREMPAWLERPLRFVAPAVLGAIVLPAIVRPEGSIDLIPASNPRFIAGVLAALAAYRWRNVSVVIVVGMVALWVIDGLF
jgi:branched-subunit amino acid transport protein